MVRYKIERKIITFEVDPQVVGTLIDYDGSICLLEIAQVPSEHTEEFKSGLLVVLSRWGN